MHQPPYEAAEMVAMEMGNQNGADLVGVELETIEPNERRRAAIQEKAAGGHLDAERRLQPTACSEGVAAADDCQPQGTR